MPEPQARKPITLTAVSFGMTVNIGDYESVKFDLTASVSPDEDWRDVLESLRRKARNLKAQIREHGS